MDLPSLKKIQIIESKIGEHSYAHVKANAQQAAPALLGDKEMLICRKRASNVWNEAFVVADSS